VGRAPTGRRRVTFPGGTRAPVPVAPTPGPSWPRTSRLAAPARGRPSAVGPAPSLAAAHPPANAENVRYV